MVKAIQFPLMSQKEFISFVFDSNILSMKEIVDMMKLYSGVSLNSPLPFLHYPQELCLPINVTDLVFSVRQILLRNILKLS